MATQHPDLFAALAAPFDPSEVKVRQQNSRMLHYITARVAMNRLDNVLGPENWWDRYVPGENSVLCELTIRLPDGSTLTKSDAGGYAGMSDQGDDDKSGYSDAFKRACVKFGVARYLYRDGVPGFVRDHAPRVEPTGGTAPQVELDVTPPPPAGEHRKERNQWGPGQQQPAAAAANGHGHDQGGNGGGGRGHGAPRSGKALFAWTKEMEQRYSVGLLKYLNGWAKLQDFPGRMVDWDAEQVELAYQEAQRKLASIQGAGPDAYEEALAN